MSSLASLERGPLSVREHFCIDVAGLDDLHLIMDSWCAGQADSPHYGPVAPEIFKVEMRARVRRILCHAKCAVARPTEALKEAVGDSFSPKSVLAWACYDWDNKTNLPVVHFAYTKMNWRRKGLARALLTTAASVRPVSSTFWATHTSGLGKKLTDALNGTYNPFLHEYLYEKRPDYSKKKGIGRVF